MSWFEAYERSLRPLLGPADLLAVLSAAESAGIVQALRTPSTPAEIAVRVGRSEPVLRAVCHALAVYDVAVLEDGRYRLAPDWMVLSDEAAFSPLSVQLAKAEVD